MIQVEKLSYGFPAKDLYKEISFTLEKGQHAAFIGSNGAGKSTLVDMMIHPDKHLYDGKIIMDESCRIGYASQFVERDKDQQRTVFEYLSERFVENQQATLAVCEAMATAEDTEALFEAYQGLLDAFEAMDGDNYENNIRKQLYIAGMRDLETLTLSQLSGGEYKLLQIMREMLLSQNLLILDEPDVFLDFGNLNRLCQIINGYKGTLLVITHNRYLLNHCFNKILHLENGDIQEFEGTYSEYRSSLLKEKLRLKLQRMEEQKEIERTEKLIDIFHTRAASQSSGTIGKAASTKISHLERLVARQIKAPFIELREPKIDFQEVAVDPENTVLKISDYNLSFDENLLENVSFELQAGEKVAIVGANGTGKTTLIRDILKNNHPSIHINENTSYAYLSQLQDDNLDDTKTVFEVMEDLGFETEQSIRDYLKNYCLEGDTLLQKVAQLSGGEKNLLQIAMIANSKAELLILDEPTSHLDIYAQMALEAALAQFKGSVIMVSHDFYLITSCADYVLLVDNNTVKRTRARTFRKMVYDQYFDQAYLETDKQKQELEANITLAFKNNDFTTVEKLCNQLEALNAK